ncbi:hypothetical protein [Bartonella sp. cb54]|uniref:hypothetical protein n=1 Tax=Bartonella sp. cb54 TaxID=3385560 RepID=UPI0039A6C01B
MLEGIYKHEYSIKNEGCQLWICFERAEYDTRAQVEAQRCESVLPKVILNYELIQMRLAKIIKK